MPRPSPALVLAMIALIVALSGSAFAAKPLITGKDIKNKSIGAADIKPNAIRSSHIKNGAVRTADIKNKTIQGRDISSAARRSLGKGAPGPQGPAGPAGAQGPKGDQASLDGTPFIAGFYAAVESDGSLGGSDLDNVTSSRVEVGRYFLFLPGVTTWHTFALIATPEGVPAGPSGPSSTSPRTAATASSTNAIQVEIFEVATGDPVDSAFSLAVFC